MTLRRWIRRSFTRPVTCTIRKSPRHARLGVHALEDRCVPATFTVNNVRDDGSAGTLRWAIAQANVATEASIVSFDPGVFAGSQRVELIGSVGGLNGLVLTNTAWPVAIQGPTANKVWVEGPYDSAGHINHIFWINGNVHASFSNLIVAGGFSESALSGGGGMHNEGTVNLADCDFLENVALTAGGGLENLGNASLTTCRFTGNKALDDEISPSQGGAIANRGTMMLTTCTITHNATTGNGGGLLCGGPTTLNNCNVRNNTAYGNGGGLYVNEGVTLNNSIVSGNAAYRGGGMYNGGVANLNKCNVNNNTSSSYGGGLLDLSGRLNLTNCTISSNAGSYGGGLFNWTAGSRNNPGIVILIDCTISGNTASRWGGGLYNTTTLGLTNCTISDNVSSDQYYGGGLYNSGTAEVLNCTFYHNQSGVLGGGMYNGGSATLTSCTFNNNSTGYAGGGLYNEDHDLRVINTIFAWNGAQYGEDIFADYFFTSLGHNLIHAIEGSDNDGNPWIATDLIGADPLLGPLGNNGGPTETMALRRSSPAIHTGASIAGIVTDQRGFSLDSPPDIGAFQTQRLTIPTEAPAFAVGAGPGMEPRVNVYDGNGTLIRTIQAYQSAFRGGVHVATADVNGDSIPDTITAPGFGGGPVVRIWDGATGTLESEFNAYDPSFRGGVNIAVVKLLNALGPAQIITGPGPGGGPHVKVFSTQTRAVLASFLAYDPRFTGGISVAATPATPGGPGHIITGAGPGGGPHVRVFSATGAPQGPGFMAYDLSFFGGVNVAALRNSDIITAPVSGGGPVVREFSLSGHLKQQFLAYDFAFFGGVTLGVIPFGPDPGSAILTGAGPGGGPHVKQFEANHLSTPLHSFMAFDFAFIGGVFVG